MGCVLGVYLIHENIWSGMQESVSSSLNMFSIDRVRTASASEDGIECGRVCIYIIIYSVTASAVQTTANKHKRSES